MARDDEIAKLVGANLRIAREQRGWSQGQLALKAATPQPVLSRWEAGTRTPQLANLLAVADALAISPMTLLGRPEGGSHQDGYTAGWEACRKAVLDASFRPSPPGEG